MSLLLLLESKRVVLCVGCGGVGKTTTTAALGLRAAMAGKRVLCLTIDPARRLANSLGLAEMTGHQTEIDPALFEAAGLEVPGSLSVMMLDTKQTFDALVTKYASTPAARDRILNNQLYRYVSTSLAGTHEYMAMEKLYEVKAEGNYDIILLDTPPTSNALDFLDAPERLMGALDSAAMRWFIQVFQSSGSFNLLAKSASLVLKGISKLTGDGFIQQVAEFVSELNDLFGGFKERAENVSNALRADDVGYVLVTTPAPMAIQEVIFFSERLAEFGMKRDGFVVNRVHRASPLDATEIEVKSAISAHELALDPEDGASRLLEAAKDEKAQAAVDRHHLAKLDRALSAMAPAPARVDVPALPYDVHDLSSLSEVAAVLAP